MARKSLFTTTSGSHYRDNIYDDDDIEVDTSDEEFLNDSEETDYDSNASSIEHEESSRKRKKKDRQREKEKSKGKKRKRAYILSSDEEEGQERESSPNEEEQGSSGSKDADDIPLIELSDTESEQDGPSTSSKNHGKKRDKKETNKKRRKSNTIEESDESESDTSESSQSYESTKTEEDPFELSIPPISIHRLVMDRDNPIPSVIVDPEDTDTEEEESFIKTIMLRYHSKTHSPFVYSCDKEDDPEIELPGSYKAYFKDPPRQPFKTLLYVQKTDHVHNLLRFYRRKQKGIKINMIWFLYRAGGDIYALTTEYARHVIRNYCDFTFPGKVAARIGSLYGATRKKQLLLVGNTQLVTKQLKSAQVDGQSSEPPLLCNTFSAELKSTASIRRLPTFYETKTLLVTFGFGSIRFEKEIKILNFHLILNHLSTIHRGEQTFEFQKPTPVNEDKKKKKKHGPSRPPLPPRAIQNGDDGEEPKVIEPDSDVFMNNFIQVPSELSDELNECLFRLFRRELKARMERFKNRGKRGQPSYYDQSKPMSQVCCFDFCYKDPGQDLANAGAKQLASSCYMTFQSKQVKLPLTPSLNQLLDILTVDEEGDFMNLNLKNRDEFRAQLTKKMRLCGRFVENPNRIGRGTANLFHCLTGELVSKKTGELYWRTHNLWCHVNADYFIAVNKWFSKFLNENHLDKEEHHLTLPWNRTKTPDLLQRLRSTAMTIDEESMKDLDDFVQQYLDKTEEETPSSNRRRRKVIGFFHKPSKPDDRLADLVHVDPEGQILFYFFSTHFTTQTKYICHRIHRCRERILNAVKASTATTSSTTRVTPTKGKGATGFNSFYDGLKRKITHLEKEDCGQFWKFNSYSHFLESLGKATLVYALANTEDHPQLKGLTFESERETELIVKEEKLVQHFRKDKSYGMEPLSTAIDWLIKKDEEEKNGDENENEDGNGSGGSPMIRTIKLANIIMGKMKTQRYIQNDGMVTAKLVYATLGTFYLVGESERAAHDGAAGMKKLKEKIFQFLTKYRPKLTTSFGARLELRELENQSKLTECHVQLRVCDVRVEDKDEEEEEVEVVEEVEEVGSQEEEDEVMEVDNDEED